jgi:hypothetical protein
MHYLCMAIPLASAIGSAEVFVADEQQPAGSLEGEKPRGQPLADTAE